MVASARTVPASVMKASLPVATCTVVWHFDLHGHVELLVGVMNQQCYGHRHLPGIIACHDACRCYASAILCASQADAQNFWLAKLPGLLTHSQASWAVVPPPPPSPPLVHRRWQGEERRKFKHTEERRGVLPDIIAMQTSSDYSQSYKVY